MKLSEKITQQFQQEYPEYAELQTNRSKLGRILHRNLKFVLLILFFILTVLLNEVGTRYGLVLFHANLNNDNVGDVLSASLEYLGGLLGIIIPVIFLVAEVVSHNNKMASILDVVFERTKVRHTSAYALVTIGVELVLLGVMKSGVSLPPKLLFYTLYGVVLLNLLILLKIGLIIFSVKEIFNREFLLESLFDRVSTDINMVLAEDAKDRIGRLAYRTELDRLRFQKQYTFNPIPSSMTGIKLKKTGFITDVNLDKLTRFSTQFGDNDRPIFIRGLYDHITPNETILYIPHQADETNVQQQIKSIFSVGDLEKSNNNLPRLLEQLQSLARKDILNKNPNSFYVIFEYYTQLIVDSGLFELPKMEDSTGVDHNSWSNEQLDKDIRALIKLTCKEDSSTEFLEIILNELQLLARKFITPEVTNNQLNVLEKILAYFDEIYRYSFKYKNQFGVQNSTIYLNSLMADWANQVNKIMQRPSDFNKLSQIYQHIYYCMEQLLMYAFVNSDFQTVNSLLIMMNPTNLKENYALFDSDCKTAYVEWSRNPLATTPPVPMFQPILGLEKQMVGIFDLFPFIILGWAIEQYEEHNISLERFKQIWKITVPNLPDLEHRLAYLSNPYSDVERWFESAVKYKIDSRYLMYLACFYVSMKEFEYAKNICPTIIKNINMKRILIIRDQIYKDQHKWWSLLEIREEEFLERLDATVALYQQASE